MFNCPIPIKNYPTVQLAHGGGGSLMNQLIEKMFLASFDSAPLKQRHDSAMLDLPRGRIAFTTDSYVIRPLFFPGGDIGKLAIFGTVNDLAMAGAKPLYLSVGFILEEGLPMEILWKVICSMKEAAEATGVQIATGDTKVVDKGKGDGIFINTSGIGVMDHSLNIAPGQVREGDVMIVNGDLGRHGMAIMAVREGLEFETAIESDAAPLADMILDLIGQGIEIHCMRDLTRGGLASALNEISSVCGLSMEIGETKIPVREDAKAACELLGFDPLYVANEGRCVVFVPANQAPKALEIMLRHDIGKESVVIGQVTKETPTAVYLKNAIGAVRIVDMLSGEQLPRIC